MKTCPNCGSEVENDAQYCTRCGWKFTTDQVAENQAVSPTQTSDISAADSTAIVADDNSSMTATTQSSNNDSPLADDARLGDEAKLSDQETTNSENDMHQATSAVKESLDAQSHQSPSKSRSHIRQQPQSPAASRKAMTTWQAVQKTWRWLIESLRHPGEYQEPFWRGTGIVFFAIEALLTVMIITRMLTQLTDTLTINFTTLRLRVMTPSLFIRLWLLVLVTWLLIVTTTYLMGRYLYHLNKHDWLDWTNQMAWESNFNIVLLLCGLLLALIGNSSSMLTLIGMILLLVLGLLNIVSLNAILNVTTARFDRFYGALILLAINGVLTWGMLSLGGGLIRQVLLGILLN